MFVGWLDLLINSFKEYWVGMVCLRCLIWKIGEMIILLIEKGKLEKDLVLGVIIN